MHIDLRTPGVRLPRGRAQELLLRVRAAFACVAGGIARVAVRVRPVDGAPPSARDCEIEVHLRDGSVEVVHERRRGLGTVLGKALLRAWQQTMRRLGVAPPRPQEPRLYAPLHARLLLPAARDRSRGAQH